MTRSPVARASWILLSLSMLAAVASPAAAEPLADPQRQVRIRTNDRRLANALDAGIARSLTFRLIVAGLDESDVVVYLQRDLSPATAIDGRLQFLAAAAGVRYVVATIATIPNFERQVALVAHELRHAMEIAHEPAIVDSRTMEAAYARIGYRNRWISTKGVAYETKAAREAGEQVLRELLRIGVRAE